MKNIKEILNKNINIRNSYIVGMSLLIFLICISTTSYALFTATAERQGALNIVSGNLYALIKSDSIDANKQIVISPGEDKNLKIELTNVNNIDAKFLMYYETTSNSVSVGCMDTSDICPIENGIELTKNGTEKDTAIFNIQITNNGNSKATIKFGANVGFSDKSINLVQGQHQLYEVEPVIISVAGAKSLIDKANKNQLQTEEKKEEMYEFIREENQKEYRFVGQNPNNYIKYNEEIWRIIGVFQTEDQNGAIQDRIKIIKEDPLPITKWNDNNQNNWTTSTLRENINSKDFYDLLSDKAKSQIENAKWYLGNIDIETIGTEDAFNSERNTNKNEKVWIGNVGLMYPSDYGYTFSKNIDNICFTNLNNCMNSTPSSSWLYKNIDEWTITSLSNNENKVFVISKNGALNNIESNLNTHFLRPVVYLRHDIKLASGKGTKEDPYIIEE